MGAFFFYFEAVRIYVRSASTRRSASSSRAPRGSLTVPLLVALLVVLLTGTGVLFFGHVSPSAVDAAGRRGMGRRLHRTEMPPPLIQLPFGGMFEAARRGDDSNFRSDPREGDSGHAGRMRCVGVLVRWTRTSMFSISISLRPTFKNSLEIEKVKLQEI